MLSADPQDAIAVYLREIEANPPLSEEEQVELLAEIRQGGDSADAAMYKLLNATVRWVPPIALRHSKSTTHCPDLVAEGNIALMKSVHSFRPESRQPFSTYAVRCIEAAILEAVVR